MATPKTQYTILGLLKMMGTASGYQLKKVMSESTEHFWSEAFGSIYPTFRKLEGQDLITKIGTESVGRRISIIYSITTRGEEVLNKWLQVEPEAQKPRNELLLKIFFIHDQPDQARKLIEAHRSKIEDEIAVFHRIETKLLKEEANSPEFPYWMMTLRHGMIHARASLNWCNECIENLKEEK